MSFQQMIIKKLDSLIGNGLCIYLSVNFYQNQRSNMHNLAKAIMAGVRIYRYNKKFLTEKKNQTWIKYNSEKRLLSYAAGHRLQLRTYLFVEEKMK